MTEQGSPLKEDALSTFLTGILMGFTTSMWKVSGEGSGGVSRAFGEDLWNLTKQRASILGEPVDTSTPETGMEFFKRYITVVYQAVEDIDYNASDDTVEITVKNCKIHNYTDYLEANGVPRSAGCPFALAGIAMMEEITGDPFIIDSIESKDAASKIVLKRL